MRRDEPDAGQFSPPPTARSFVERYRWEAAPDRARWRHRSTAIELWLQRVDLGGPDIDLEAVSGVLTDTERRRAAQGLPSVRRRRILVRAALRELLGELLGMDAAEVPLSGGAGKPVLADGASGGLDFSCAASGALGLVVVVRSGRVGVDVERIRTNDLASADAEGWLSPAEVDALRGMRLGDRPRALTRAWVQKEAVLKAEGVGLRSDPAQVVTPVAEHGVVRGWSLAPLQVPTEYVASLAVAPATGTGRLRRAPVTVPC